MHRSALLIIPLALLILGAIWYFAAGPGYPAQQSSTASTTDQYYSSGTQAQAPGPQTGTAANTPGGVDPNQQQLQQQTNSTNNNQTKIMQATLHTNQGDITFEFNPELSQTAVDNFVKLAQAGFYDGTKFHRVIKGFMIQGGDPLSKDDSMSARWGTGGPGYQFKDEITSGSHNSIGMVSMANSGPNTNGSQFYINTANNNFLDGKYTVFAHVVAGMDVVTKIENTQTSTGDRPVSPMVITSITLK
jgi:cyclophilin family peptidyl-prolyl cis-trans isomerase